MNKGIPRRSRLLAAILWTGSIVAVFQEAMARPPIHDLAIQADYKVMPEPLSVEKVWNLDPDQTNPHLRRWLVSRHSEIIGMKAISRKGGKFGVSASGILSLAQGYIRPPGKWFQPYSDFRCTKGPNDWFETEEGAKIAAEEAAQYWAELLKQEKIKLSLLFERILQGTSAQALDQGDRVFKNWIKDLAVQWRSEVYSRVRKIEWKFYLDYAEANGICEKKDLPPVKSTTLTSIMEPVSGGEPLSVSQILARAPARVWDGYFSIRLNITVLGKTLNGRFLIDTESPMSVISPTWLESQGIYPVLVEIPESPLRRVKWRGQLTEIEGLAKQARVESAEVSGWVFPLKDFLVFQTDLFGPPDNVASCCDGILGTDFLRNAVVEFQSVSPPEVKIWPREEFHGLANPPWAWVELHQTPNGQIGSSSVELPQPARIGNPYFSPGNFIVDLPHGRLWYSPESVTHPTPPSNRSGLQVEYSLKKGERLLRVKEIRKGTPAQDLLKAGLKSGMTLTQVDNIPSEELDLWEVNQRLAGAYGKTVVLQWSTKEGVKMAPLNVIP